MTKDFIIREIERVIIAHKEIDELDGAIAVIASGGAGGFWDTKFVEGYKFHAELVYNLLMEHRGIEEISNEFDVFEEVMYCLAQGESVEMYNSLNEVVYTITTVEDLYDFLMNTENFVPDRENLN